MGGASNTAGISLSLDGTMREMMVVTLSEHSVHGGGGDHLEGDKSLKKQKAVSCGEWPHQLDCLQGRIQYFLVFSGAIFASSG